MSVFFMMRVRCDSAVLKLIASNWAISFVDFPSATSWRTSRSRDVSGSRGSRALSPCRTMAWSPASKILFGNVDLQWDGHDQAGSTAGSRDDLERSAHPVQPLLDADESEAARPAARMDGPHVEPHAVVADGAPELAAASRERDRHPRRLRVLRHVGQRFLHDAIERRLGRRGQPRARRALDPDVEPGSAGHTVGEELEGGLEPEIVEDGRTQLVGQVPQLLLDLVQ